MCSNHVDHSSPGDACLAIEVALRDMETKVARSTWRQYATLVVGMTCLCFLCFSGSWARRDDVTVFRKLTGITHNEPTCSSDSDCASAGSANRPHVCIEQACHPRPLFPFKSLDVAGTLSAFACIVISSGGGLGGGGLLVPLYIIVLGFSSHDAIPLSKATIFGSAVASCLLNVRKKHPLDSKRPLIDYEVMVMMEPMTLAGTIIGVSVNKVCPEWIITILLVVLLSKTSARMIQKGKVIWNHEATKDRNLQAVVVQQWVDVVRAAKYSPTVVSCAKKWRAVLNHDSKDSSQLSSVSTEVALSMASPIDDDSDLDDDNVSDNDFLLKKPAPMSGGADVRMKPSPLRFAKMDDLHEYKRSIPWGDLSVLLVAWLGLFAYSILKGGHGAPSVIGLVCGSMAYWSLTVLAFPFFVSVTTYFGFKILHRHELMQSHGYAYMPGDIQWNRRTTMLYPSLCTVAGVAAGMLGIGGGMVKGPLLLEIGMHPQVASATSTAMILFTSSATTIQFIVLGMLPYDYAAWYGAVGFLGGIVGQLGLSYLVRKYRKTAFVLFVIAGVIAVSGTVMGILGVHDIIAHGFRGFRYLCYNV
ncbi:hypothetical protein H310_06421 [Aphanomyces invadans]|uniref:Sulfite exporter TauE/SafE n=1 Tax=Aphanomyces invadans TaxID=157072 RepID=A0A024U628_9STRA|nr:hypothetical protein H310_06421 [Aphanomyces invadans]ETW01851.1 hypothetical protein H310_06421 [Aphanomyces invadans]|eukprot:XP_008869699.1 hypothetical protein H310_06421 [Aphanomyces invadans]